MNLHIKHNEHVFIAGMTQSGKTFLAKEYLRNVDQQVFVLDTKGLFSWNMEDEIIINHLSELPKQKDFKKVIYRPVWQELEPEFYDSFFKFCMMRGNCIVVVDETMQVCPNYARLPDWYKGILTRGMELGVSVWSLSQRPAKIPLEILSESTHYFIFRLNIKQDRERIIDYTGYENFIEIPEQYSFWYFNTVKAEEPVKAKFIIK